MTDNLPTPELLRKLLSYDPETGKLFWKERDVSLFSDGSRSAEHSCIAWNNRHAGNEAFTNTIPAGYKTGAIFNKFYRAHRVIWALVHGYWPKTVDHINGDPRDNRLANLRDVSHQQNMKNTKQRSDNSSGVTGVYLNRDRGFWYAQIKVNMHTKTVGTFSSFEDAVAARKAAEIEFGFHENHGRVKK